MLHSLLSPDEEYALIVEVQVRHGPEAFRALYRHYFPRVFAYVAYRVSTKQDAEDLTSDIFTKVVGSVERFEYRGEGSFAAWVFRIAYNTVTEFYRGDGRYDTAVLGTLPEIASADLLPDEAFVRKERFAQLQALISTLAPRRREIVTLRFFGGLRNQDIAVMLNLDERTVASHLCRALDDLQHKFQEEGVVDE
ncbi:MAG: sigma-70 family RNA polymerase sigma factor [Burkholderiales bacterium]|nr:sigma-70 family RNA polymerase sigma factor [Anaerolineae bacterium]